MIRQAIRFDSLSTWIAFFVGCCISLTCFADLRLDEMFTEQRLAPEISYICGDVSHYTLNEAKKLNFVPLACKEISFGFTQSDCWFHFRATNSGDKPLALVLSSDFNLFDHIDFYIPSSGETIKKSIGDTIPYNQRVLKVRTLSIGFVAQIKFELGFSLTPYLSKNALCRWCTQMSETV